MKRKSQRKQKYINKKHHFNMKTFNFNAVNEKGLMFHRKPLNNQKRLNEEFYSQWILINIILSLLKAMNRCDVFNIGANGGNKKRKGL